MQYKQEFYKDKVLGIQQPFFFPYLEYFALIAATDYWIVFDTPQYVKLSWYNRNVILDPIKGTKYITVPVKKYKFGTPINKVNVFNELPWNKKILSQLGTYKKSAPYYHQVVDFMGHALNPGYKNLSELNIHTMSETCKYIGIPFQYEVFSKMDLKVDKVRSSGDWGKVIVKAVGSKKYINAFTGQKFINKEDYHAEGIAVKFLKYTYTPYDQGENPFHPGLSIIDVMMFNSPEVIREMLQNFELV